MLTFIANGLVVSGLLILMVTFVPLRKLINELPSGQVRQKWIVQAILIGGFILGYLSYAVAFWFHSATFSDLIVPGVFFFGAVFVWLTITLSLQTAMDIRRVTLLEQENITDPLIGIYNRRCLDRRLVEEFQRAQRYQVPLSVLMIDIDHFKQINDTYGHPVGDLVLRYWGELILGVVRSSDIVARYGGEEILVIAPNTATAAALTLGERIRANIESHELVLSSESNQRQKLRITVSIGVAEYDSGVVSVEELINNVDCALYRAKQAGRNRVVICEEAPSAL
jgi:diguanylate cyclase (GGDEF)-like protein